MFLYEIKNLEYEILRGTDKKEFLSFTYDTRTLKEKELFICISGANFDSHESIEFIINKKPAYIVVEKDIDLSKIKSSVSIIKVKNTREFLALISCHYFSYPSKDLFLIGITGTKGKTSTAYMLKEVLEKNNLNVGMIGTNGIYIRGRFIESKNTTPESFYINKYLRMMKDENCTHVILEVSSQAVKQSRIVGLDFDYGIFTNISKDHISPHEHKDFEEYFSCKVKFLSLCKNLLINKEAKRFKKIIEILENKNILTYSSKTDADFYYFDRKNVSFDNFLGQEFYINKFPNEKISLSSLGEFNVSNALVASSIAYLLDIDIKNIKSAFRSLRIDGRMDIVHKNENFCVIVDYAHNKISLEHLIKTLKQYEHKRLVLLFGCGGNKDKFRRYDMGELASKYADLIILTEDNSRDEKIEDIISDISQRIEEKSKCIILHNRKDAIEYAIKNHEKGDLIAIVGKGHENYIERGSEKIYFKDSVEVERCLKELEKEGKI